MNKFFYLLLVAFGVAGLNSCGSDSSNATPKESNGRQFNKNRSYAWQIDKEDGEEALNAPLHPKQDVPAKKVVYRGAKVNISNNTVDQSNQNESPKKVFYGSKNVRVYNDNNGQVSGRSVRYMRTTR